MLLLSKEELKLYQDPKVCSNHKNAKVKNYQNVKIIVLIQGNIEVQHIVFVI